MLLKPPTPPPANPQPQFVIGQIFCIFSLMKTSRYSVIPIYLTLPRNRKIGLCEKHFEESCFSKSVDLGTRLMKSKD